MFCRASQLKSLSTYCARSSLSSLQNSDRQCSSLYESWSLGSCSMLATTPRSHMLIVAGDFANFSRFCKLYLLCASTPYCHLACQLPISCIHKPTAARAPGTTPNELIDGFARLYRRRQRNHDNECNHAGHGNPPQPGRPAGQGLPGQLQPVAVLRHHDPRRLRPAGSGIYGTLWAFVRSG